MVKESGHDGAESGRTGDGASSRRRWLALCGAAVLSGLAGCGGGGEEATEAGTEAGTGTEGDAEESTASSGGRPFSETIQYGESFAMEGTAQSEDGEMQIQGRFAGGDAYWRFEQADGTVTEQYLVDDEQYFVSDGQCIAGSGTTGTEGVGTDQFEEDADEQPDLEPAGRETIDGEELLVYEVPTDGDGTMTYYVDPETGHPRRVESPSGTFDYHSWGDVDPIQPPDMDCQEMSGMTPTN